MKLDTIIHIILSDDLKLRGFNHEPLNKMFLIPGGPIRGIIKILKEFRREVITMFDKFITINIT